MLESLLVKIAWVSLVVTLLVTIGLLIRLRVNTRLMLLLIPFLILTSGTWIWLANDLAGRPRAGEPPTDSIIVKIVEARPKWVYLWVVEQAQHRLYRLPWTEQRGRRAQEAQDQMEGHGRVFVYRRPADTEQEAEEFYQFQLQDHVKKQ